MLDPRWSSPTPTHGNPRIFPTATRDRSRVNLVSAAPESAKLRALVSSVNVTNTRSSPAAVQCSIPPSIKTRSISDRYRAQPRQRRDRQRTFVHLPRIGTNANGVGLNRGIAHSKPVGRRTDRGTLSREEWTCGSRSTRHAAFVVPPKGRSFIWPLQGDAWGGFLYATKLKLHRRNYTWVIFFRS